MIMSEPEIIYNMPFRDYQEAEGVNMSTAKHMATSPMDYKYHLDNRDDDDERFALGTAAHVAMLEPRRFLEEYVIQPETRFDEKKGKEVNFIRNGQYWEAFKAQHQGRRIIKKTVYDDAWALQEAVRRNKDANRMLSFGDREVSVFWTHRPTGLRCKARLDVLSLDADDGYILDPKTAKDITGREFARACGRLRYHWQAAFCVDGIREATGKVLPFYWAAIHTAKPHDTVVYYPTDRALELGRTQYNTALERIAECRSKRAWPGISSDPVELDLPPWEYPDEIEPEPVITTEDAA